MAKNPPPGPGRRGEDKKFMDQRAKKATKFKGVRKIK